MQRTCGRIHRHCEERVRRPSFKGGKRAVSGPPLRIHGALEAVKTWKYEPTYLHCGRGGADSDGDISTGAVKLDWSKEESHGLRMGRTDCCGNTVRSIRDIPSRDRDSRIYKVSREEAGHLPGRQDGGSGER